MKMLRRYRARSLADSNRRLLNARLDNITRLIAEIHALPEGASAKELTDMLLREAEDANCRARYVEEFTAKAAEAA